MLACLTDLKTRYLVDPERVVLRGSGRCSGPALTLAAAQPELFAACALFRPTRFTPVKRLPPCMAFVTAPRSSHCTPSVSKDRAACHSIRL